MGALVSPRRGIRSWNAAGAGSCGGSGCGVGVWRVGGAEGAGWLEGDGRRIRVAGGRRWKEPGGWRATAGEAGLLEGEGESGLSAVDVVRIELRHRGGREVRLVGVDGGVDVVAKGPECGELA